MTYGRRYQWTAGIAALLLLLSAPGCYAVQEVLRALLEIRVDVPALDVTPAEPLPAGPDAFTWKHYSERAMEWQEEVLLSTYEKYGERSPKWDEKAKEFLREYAEFQYGVRSQDAAGRCRELGEELSELGCSDPRILYMRGNVVYQLEGGQKALPLIKRSLAPLEASEYPRIWPYFATRRLQWILKDTHRHRDEVRALNPKKMRYLGQAAGDPDFADGSQRYYMEEALVEWDGLCRMPDDAEIMIDELERIPDVDPWIRHMLRGLYHVSKGWKARGGGWAGEVTDEGWEVFHRELSLATEDFTEAYTLHPEYPEAATWMISVAMASSGGPGERVWFERAVSAQFDYRPAYDKLMWALRPRWGGSHEKMYQFGIECLNTGRFDTEIPRVLLKALWDIGSELDDWRDAYRRPGAYEQLQTFYEGMLAEPTRADWHSFWQSSHGMVAWAAGRYEDSKRLFDELGDDVYMEVFPDFDCEADFVLGDVQLRTGALRETYEKAEALYADDQVAAALPLFEELRDKAAPESSALALLRHRVAVVKTRAGFLSGEWADLIPDADLAGWQCKGGEWAVDADGALKGRSRKSDAALRLVCRCPIDGDYEIRGELEGEFNVGIVLGHRERHRPYFVGFKVDGHEDEVTLNNEFSIQEYLTRPMSLGERNHIRVRVANGLLTACVNEELVFDEQPIDPDWCAANDGQIGVGGSYYKSDGVEIRFRNLQIRRLNAEQDADEVFAIRAPF